MTACWDYLRGAQEAPPEVQAYIRRKCGYLDGKYVAWGKSGAIYFPSFLSKQIDGKNVNIWVGKCRKMCKMKRNKPEKCVKLRSCN